MAEIDEMFERLSVREKELQAEGFELSVASKMAWLEERVRQWPSAWGEDLQVLIYGDFQPPKKSLEYPSLAITIHPEKQENTIIRGPRTVLKGTVKVSEKSVAAIMDAGRRLNLLLGSHTLRQWGNSKLGWWSSVTHDSISGVQTDLEDDGVGLTINGLLYLRGPDIRRKVEAALFWVRDPRRLLMHSYQSDVLRVYASYWNAFECLVDAVCILEPQVSLSRTEKQAKIDEFWRERGQPTAKSVGDCYWTIVDTGFRGKATHALEACFGEKVGRYFSIECFGKEEAADRLYRIRNSINHGDIEAENPHELIRVEVRLTELWRIVWGMFGRLVPMPTPANPKISE